MKQERHALIQKSIVLLLCLQGKVINATPSPSCHLAHHQKDTLIGTSEPGTCWCATISPFFIFSSPPLFFFHSLSQLASCLHGNIPQMKASEVCRVASFHPIRTTSPIFSPFGKQTKSGRLRVRSNSLRKIKLQWRIFRRKSSNENFPASLESFQVALHLYISISTFTAQNKKEKKKPPAAFLAQGMSMPRPHFPSDHH